jgi:hypothetical protein
MPPKGKDYRLKKTIEPERVNKVHREGILESKNQKQLFQKNNPIYQ